MICVLTSCRAEADVEGKSVSSIVLDMVLDHEGMVNLRLASSASGSMTGICLMPASALSLSRLRLRESGFPVGSRCHRSSCRNCESMTFSWDTRRLPFNILDVISGPFMRSSSSALAYTSYFVTVEKPKLYSFPIMVAISVFCTYFWDICPSALSCFSG